MATPNYVYSSLYTYRSQGGYAFDTETEKNVSHDLKRSKARIE